MQKMKTSSLLNESLQLCLSRAPLLLIGILLFGSISAASSLWMERHMSDFTHTMIDPIQKNNTALSVLLSAMENGSNDDVVKAAVELQNNGTMGLDALSLIGDLMPVIQIMLWSVMVVFLISCLSSLYFLCCMALQTPSFFSVCTNFFLSLPAMILIVVWSSVRSFSWIPIIGPLIGLILFPRFLFAPVIYLQEQKSVMAAVRKSYTQTKGSTWYILTTLSIVSFIAMLVATLVIVSLSLSLDPLIGRYSVVLRSMIWQLSLCYTIASLVVMWKPSENVNIVV